MYSIWNWLNFYTVIVKISLWQAMFLIICCSGQMHNQALFLNQSVKCKMSCPRPVWTFIMTDLITSGQLKRITVYTSWHYWKRLQWALVIGFCASLPHIYSHVSLMLRLFSGQILSCVQVVSSFICTVCLQKFVINEGGMGWDDWAGRRELFCLVWFPNSLVVILHDFWWEQWPGQPVSTFIAVWDRIETLSRSLYPRPPSNVPSDWTTLEHVGPLLGLSADYQITQDACWRQVIMGLACKKNLSGDVFNPAWPCCSWSQCCFFFMVSEWLCVGVRHNE